MERVHESLSKAGEESTDYLAREIEGSDRLAIKITEKYDKGYSVKHIYDRQSDFIIRFLADYSPKSVLDLGCGMGNFLNRANGHFERLIGVDPAPESLGAAKRIVPEADFRQGQGESLPLHDGEVDAVVMKGVVHHLKDPIAVFQEVYRCLTPGGVIVIFEGNRSSAYRRIVLALADVLSIDHESTLFEHRAPKVMAQMLTSVGFNPFRKKNISGLFVPLGLSEAGGSRTWIALDGIENVLQMICPILFNYHVLLAARKPGAEGN